MSVAKKGLKLFLIFCCAVAAIITTLFAVAIGRTLTLQEINFEFDPFTGVNYELSDDQFQKYLNTFGNSLKFKTVSMAPGHYDRDELYNLQEFFKRSYPLVFGSPHVEVEYVGNYSLLLYVKGYDTALKPYMLTSHIDVVSVDSTQWSLDPFLGEVVPDPITGEDVVWGRGAIDDKVGVIGILSALEFLLQNKWQPKRSFYIGFGHDEEVSGADGAGQIAALLKKRDVSLEFLMDEGMPILKGMIKGVECPVACIAVSEKGRMNVELTVEAIGGHSSFPPHEQATEILASAIQRIYSNPHPSMFGLGPEEDMLKYLAPKASWPYKIFFANTWLFGPLLSYVMSLKRETNALMRTTTAVTMVRAGLQDNVVPATAWALVNHRIHPAQTVEAVFEHDVASVADPRVKLKMAVGVKPHPISPYGPESVPFRLIVGATKHVFPEAVPVPGLMIANTDTQNYLNFTSAIYRFYPIMLGKEDLASIHGKNERLSVLNFRAAILFYVRLIQLADASTFQHNFQSTREAGEL